MGVIKRVENLFEIRCSVSEETLYLPSSDEEEYNYSDHEEERQRRPRRILRQRPPPVGPTFSSVKSHSGKKKFRRYHNGINKYNFGNLKVGYNEVSVRRIQRNIPRSETRYIRE